MSLPDAGPARLRASLSRRLSPRSPSSSSSPRQKPAYADPIPTSETARRRSRTSMDMPSRFAETSDEEESDDVCAPTSGVQLNQSIFGLIAAAGSAVGLQQAVQGEVDEDEWSRRRMSQTVPSLLSPSGRDGATAALADSQYGVPSSRMSQAAKHKRRSSKQLLVKSLHKLRLRPIRERKASSGAEDMMSSSQILPPRRPEPEVKADTEEDKDEDDQTLSNAPILSKILTARAEMHRQVVEGDSTEQEARGRQTSPRKAPLSLAREVQKLFKFNEMQEIIAEYRCSLLSGTPCPGYLFVTKLYICFYAYLPQSTAKAVKSGYLSKRGMRDPRYHRYYCELKGHVLSFYEDPAQINYPRSLIDMRRSLNVHIAGHEKGKDDSHLTLETDKREYQLRADSAESANEWVDILRQEYLNTHNDGGLIKITLPIANILDIEQNYIRDLAIGTESVRIRIIDNDETYVMDEYFFTFGRQSEEVIRVLKLVVEGRDGPSDSEASESEVSRRSLSVERPSAVPARTPALRESVRSTLVPQPPGIRSPSSSRLSSESRRSSLDVRRPSLDTRRRSYDDGRRSVSITRSPLSPGHQDSIASPTSIDPDTESSAAIQSMDETLDGSNASDSQILNNSGVFRVPTIHAPSPPRAKSDSPVDPLHRASQDTERLSGPPGQATSKPRRPPPIARVSTGGLSFSEQDAARMQGSNYSIGRLVKAGMSPLQSASGIAGFLGKQSKQMSSLLATESMGYYEKVAGMWQGEARHYGSIPGSRPDDDKIPDDQDVERELRDTLRFREHFALPESEQLLASWHCYQQRTIPLYGKLYLGSTHLCWRPLMAPRTTKMKLPVKVIETVVKGTSYRLGYSGMCLVVAGDEEVFFDFRDTGLRDDCSVTLLRYLNSVDPSRQLAESGLLSEGEIIATEVAKAEHKAVQDARRAERLGQEDEEHDALAESMMFDPPLADSPNFRPSESLRITCLTIGSRGDVQPYIALCKGLLEDGHKPRIATHVEFGDWIKGHGIDFEPIEGDPAVLMQLCVENGMFTLSFMKEATLHFRAWIDGLMESAWKACQNSDLIIESPSAMVGIHISEALQVPYFRAFTMPWTRTRAFPHAFFVPNNKSGGTYNYMTYTLFDTFFWKSTAGQINAWRKNMLGLKSTSLSRMQVNKVPFLYNFSKAVVRQPLDWSDWVRITGYWFLNEEHEEGWIPPKELADFIKKARTDGKKLVYIGFGSITVDNPALLTETVVKAVMGNDLRCVLSKGWSDRLVKSAAATAARPAPAEPVLPPEILQVRYSVPHSWLFPQMDAITHHGGAGTTGASLRAGKPTIIKPFFGDQYFFGSRVEDLGVGIYVRIMNEKKFGRALYYATHDERIRRKAKWIGEQIRAENGVQTAIQAIYRDLEYARSLVQKKINGGNGSGGLAGDGETPGEVGDGDGEVDPFDEVADEEGGEGDEQWTFISEDSDDDDDDRHSPQGVMQRSTTMAWDAREKGLVVGAQIQRATREKEGQQQHQQQRREQLHHHHHHHHHRDGSSRTSLEEKGKAKDKVRARG